MNRDEDYYPFLKHVSGSYPEQQYHLEPAQLNYLQFFSNEQRYICVDVKS